MKFKTSTGVTLDDEHPAVATCKKWIEIKKLKNVRVFHTDINTLLLVVNEQPEFESDRVEDIACHIDMLALAKEDTK